MALVARGVRARSGPSQRVWPGARPPSSAAAMLCMPAPRQRVAVNSWWAEAIDFSRPENVFRKESMDEALRADCAAIDWTEARTFFTR